MPDGTSPPGGLGLIIHPSRCQGARSSASHGSATVFGISTCCNHWISMKRLIACMAVTAWSLCTAVSAQGLDTSLRREYPSLLYVERYRAAYPQDVQGSTDAWKTATTVPRDATASALSQRLVGLADQHVALTGDKAGKTETLGVLFRTSSDGHLVVWHVLDARITTLAPGDEVLRINHTPTQAWLKNAARLTFGGNDRSRQAEAALSLALGTPAAHQVARLGKTLEMRVRTRQRAPRTVTLHYQPMTQDLAKTLASSVDLPDLPEIVTIGHTKVGTLRMGAFAPQYSATFTTAAEAAETAAPESNDTDAPMLAGFCAVTKELIGRYDALAKQSDVMLIDLRGNMGGFAREVRGLAWAISGRKPVHTYEMSASGKAGIVRLEALPEDASCGTVASQKPLLVLVDAGTRSAGELLATYLWANGATVIGERTIGAGGGRDSKSDGIALGETGYRALVSESFYVFDPTHALHAGEMQETALIDRVATEGFRPSRTRPYATQSIGVLPDVPLVIQPDDLQDGGRQLLARGVTAAGLNK
ncbi:S41 family peptidase [Xanthomonas campestris]|uniref:S41 family peptidase n=1 Tax=Xanthomonas campestris TaxID=339 RepID=UPI002359E6A1|nr:S41 family peptidase [Xanthomonas campestris]MDC8747675.1 S41 family peptidase [Xanthomonas campestris]